MSPKQRIIIDTDPGVDDVMAMLLALSASREELEVLMLSVTYGNVPLQSCLKNVVALFNVLEKELKWRESMGYELGYDAMRANKPIVAAGADHPLEDEILMADYFHGADGLHNVHDTHPHLSPAETWETVFREQDAESIADQGQHSPYFTPSKLPAHVEMLRLLKDNPADTISILAVGPLTNVALAAAEDPETFLKVKELIVMGGAIEVEGNITPVAEFNTFADSVASARVFALTSRTPNATLPPQTQRTKLLPYPERLSRPLRLVLCPLDITCRHNISKSFFNEHVTPHLDAGSPLALWASHILTGAFKTIESMWLDSDETQLSLHDPFTVWYALTHDDPDWRFLPKPEDIRIETVGQWSRGMHVADRRGKRKPAEAAVEASADPHSDPDIVALDTVHGDNSYWQSALKCNRIYRLVGSPGEELFKEVWMQRVFGTRT